MYLDRIYPYLSKHCHQVQCNQENDEKLMAHCSPQYFFPGLSAWLTRDLETRFRTVLLSDRKCCLNCAIAALECRLPALGLLRRGYTWSNARSLCLYCHKHCLAVLCKCLGDFWAFWEKDIFSQRIARLNWGKYEMLKIWWMWKIEIWSEELV